MNASRELEQPIREQLPTKDREPRFIAAITISGPAGTGKTVTAERLVQKIQEYTGQQVTFLKVGEKFFRNPHSERTGQEVIGAHERAVSVDEQIDKEQAKLIQNATSASMLVLEGWTSGFVACEERAKAIKGHRARPAVITFLFTADDAIRIPRAYHRQLKKDPNLTYEEFVRATREREQNNIANWEQVHPQIQGVKDPYSKDNVDKNGNPLFDYVIDTSYLFQDEVLDVVCAILTEGKMLPKSPEVAVLEKNGTQIIATNGTIVDFKTA